MPNPKKRSYYFKKLKADPEIPSLSREGQTEKKENVTTAVL